MRANRRFICTGLAGLVLASALFATGGNALGQTQETYLKPYTGADLSKEASAGRGERLFNLHFLPIPVTDVLGGGLGPLFNRNACSTCHPAGGRGKAPSDPFEPLLTALVRLSVEGQGADGAPNPHPDYGSQLGTRGIRGVAAEAEVEISYDLLVGEYDDGEPYRLRRPQMAFSDESEGSLDDALTSLRIGQPIYGLGLLEAVDDEQILAHADPDDADGDGISGRPNRVWSYAEEKPVIGRFGWKANEPDLFQQSAAAFLGDIGITSPLFPKHDCGIEQDVCQDADTSTVEVSDADIVDMVAYLRALSPPQRVDGAATDRGQSLFRSAGCSKCHRPRLGKASAPEPYLNDVEVMAYTDLLLHDMGEGLADGRPDFQASGQEWRTPPLWGLGRVEEIHGEYALLHDGRAQSIPEAVLWHGGEAASSRDAFKAMSKDDRDALIAFLKSL